MKLASEHSAPRKLQAQSSAACQRAETGERKYFFGGAVKKNGTLKGLKRGWQGEAGKKNTVFAWGSKAWTLKGLKRGVLAG